MISGKRLEKRSVKELPAAILQKRIKVCTPSAALGREGHCSESSHQWPMIQSISYFLRNVNINSQIFGSESVLGGNAMT